MDRYTNIKMTTIIINTIWRKSLNRRLNYQNHKHFIFESNWHGLQWLLTSFVIFSFFLVNHKGMIIIIIITKEFFHNFFFLYPRLYKKAFCVTSDCICTIGINSDILWNTEHESVWFFENLFIAQYRSNYMSYLMITMAVHHKLNLFYFIQIVTDYPPVIQKKNSC